MFNNGIYQPPGSPSGTVTGSGTLNFVAKWTPSGSQLGNSQIFDDGTNVTIGTGAAGSQKLQVAGNIAPEASGTRTLGTTGLRYSALYLSSTIDYTSNLAFSVSGAIKQQFQTDGSALMIGNVIVGSPNLLSDTRFNVVSADSGSTNYNVKLQDSGLNPLFYMKNNGTIGIGSDVVASNRVYILDTTNTNALRIDTAIANTLIVGSNGNVGIGSSTPNLTLDVRYNNGSTLTGPVNTSGSINIRNTNTTNDNYMAFNFQSANGDGSGTFGVQVTNHTPNAISNFFWTFPVGTGAVAMQLFSDGDLSLGTGLGNNSARFHLVGVDATSSNYAFKAEDSATGVLLFLRNDGNAGFGINSWGTSATKTISIGNGTAPGSNVTDGFQLYSNDIVAGNAAPHFRTENGSIIKLFKSSAYTISNVTTDRSYDANATTLDEIADTLGTLVSDLQATGLIG